MIGKSIAKPISGRYARLAPFLLMTCEGGSVALPLYIALVGAEHAVNIITFDVAGILINFGLVPAAKVGHIGMYRDEKTLKPVEYLVKLPEDISQRQIFVVDPMLATGGSAILAIDSLKRHLLSFLILQQTWIHCWLLLWKLVSLALMQWHYLTRLSTCVTSS